jgi:hypothetical protein
VGVLDEPYSAKPASHGSSLCRLAGLYGCNARLKLPSQVKHLKQMYSGRRLIDRGGGTPREWKGNIFKVNDKAFIKGIITFCRRLNNCVFCIENKIDKLYCSCMK